MLTRSEASEILEQCNVDHRADFYALSRSCVELILWHAKKNGYRKARNAPGSTARMYHAYLQRRATDRPFSGPSRKLSLDATIWAVELGLKT